MFFIPGILISILTFPGVIVHEAAHMFFCRVRKVAVLDVCFFQFQDPSGYVIHEDTEDYWSTFLIAMGPFLVNTLVCFALCFPAFLVVDTFKISDPLSYFLMYMGISIGMHAFPSTQDVKNVWDQSKAGTSKFQWKAVLTFPLVALVFLANFGRFLWLDFIYGFAVGVGLPKLILDALSK